MRPMFRLPLATANIRAVKEKPDATMDAVGRCMPPAGSIPVTVDLAATVFPGRRLGARALASSGFFQPRPPVEWNNSDAVE